MNWRLLTIFLFILFFSLAQKVLAVTSVTIPSEFSTTNSFLNDETKTVQVSVSVSSTGSAYLRPVFYSALGSYFGCTKGLNISSFECGTDPTAYPMISGPGDFTLSIKPDLSSPFYIPNSDASFMVRRCTQSGCGGGTNDSNVIPVHFVNTSPQPTATPAPTPTPTPTPTPDQPKNISLNEFAACPSGSSEWIELYNGNDSTVTLTDWSMKDDKDNTVHINGQINGKSYGVFDVSNLNNDIDTVRIYDGAGFSVESKHYDSCISTQTWAKKTDGSWAQTPLITKGAANAFPAASPTPTPTPKGSPTPDPATLEGADVLGESTGSGSIPTYVVDDPSPSPEASASGTMHQKESPLFGILAIVLGTGSLVGLGGYLWYDWKKSQPKLTSA